jgi:hypothetical protein
MEGSGRVVWRVRDPEGVSRENVFDAVVLPPSPLAGEPERHCGLSTPYEAERPDQPFTLVVRVHEGENPLTVECVVFGADGTRLCAGWSTDRETVIIRSPHHLEVKRLPASEPDPFRQPPN